MKDRAICKQCEHLKIINDVMGGTFPQCDLDFRNLSWQEFLEEPLSDKCPYFLEQLIKSQNEKKN